MQSFDNMMKTTILHHIPTIIMPVHVVEYMVEGFHDLAGAPQYMEVYMTVDKSTPLWDAGLSDEERVEWLLNEMTIDEKVKWISSFSSDVERLGIPGNGYGGEAAHGVEGRNDQNGIGVADVTTSFPQPIGMSATWDTEMIRKAGEITGTESRVTYHRHPRFGLSRWAPTVDLERDPRWGRNEEGYGEDPVLTGAMASAYIRGMQGDDAHFIRCAATLKHFYGNNTEVGRGWKNSSIDVRNKYELYLEPFRRCIEHGGAEGVMTAYNKINGTVGILNHEVNDILKKEYGLHHVVSDGGALTLVTTLAHVYGQSAEAVANALHAGVDAMSDPAPRVWDAVGEALELNLISEEDLNIAIRNVMKTKLRLGVYDRENKNPYDTVTEKDIDTEENRAFNRQFSGEAVVLLKNEPLNGQKLLPLAKPSVANTEVAADGAKIALIGPMADAWHQDWYGGEPPYRKTLRDGIREVTGCELPYADGYNRVRFMLGDKGLAVNEENLVVLSECPDVFIEEYWGEGSYNYRSERTGKYIHVEPDESVAGVKGAVHGTMKSVREHAFDWFVCEIIRHEQAEGGVILNDRFGYPLFVDEDNVIRTGDAAAGTCFVREVVENGLDRAVELAKTVDTVILAVGCNAMVNAKEEIDRKTMDLPENQQEMIRRITEVNPKTVLVLFTNYPYTFEKEAAMVPAILMSATGSQDMGSAMADQLFGLANPAGRLNQTWYADMADVPCIDDYDIIGKGRTYRYFAGRVQYPFGYGLSYTDFEYANFTVETVSGKGCETGFGKQTIDCQLEINLDIINVGDRMGDEVVEIYAIAPTSRARKPLRQLIAFTREHDLAPGECRHVTLYAAVEELRFYDVVSDRLMVESGEYTVFAGKDALHPVASSNISIEGETVGRRSWSKRTPAENYDSYDNMYLTEGHFGYHALTVADPAQKGVVTYRDCDLPKNGGILSLHMMSRNGVNVEVYLNDKKIGAFSGDTVTCEQNSTPKMDRYAYREVELRNQFREPVYEDIMIPMDLTEEEPKNGGELRIEFAGDVRFCYYKMQAKAKKGELLMGVAN